MFSSTPPDSFDESQKHQEHDTSGGNVDTRPSLPSVGVKDFQGDGAFPSPARSPRIPAGDDTGAPEQKSSASGQPSSGEERHREERGENCDKKKLGLRIKSGLRTGSEVKTYRGERQGFRRDVRNGDGYGRTRRDGYRHSREHTVYTVYNDRSHTPRREQDMTEDNAFAGDRDARREYRRDTERSSFDARFRHRDGRRHERERDPLTDNAFAREHDGRRSYHRDTERRSFDARFRHRDEHRHGYAHTRYNDHDHTLRRGQDMTEDNVLARDRDVRREYRRDTERSSFDARFRHGDARHREHERNMERSKFDVRFRDRDARCHERERDGKGRYWRDFGQGVDGKSTASENERRYEGRWNKRGQQDRYQAADRAADGHYSHSDNDGTSRFPGYDRFSGNRDMLDSSRPRRSHFDVIVLGAGASGLLCTAQLVSGGLSAALLDRSRTPGRKLSMAGGGHANFSNTRLGPGHYISDTEGFVDPVLARVGVRDICRVMDVLRLRYEERENGKLFLRDKADALVSALLRHCRKGPGVFDFFAGEALDADCLEFDKDVVILRTRTGLKLTARHCVLALGSPALPVSGASGIGYAIAQHIGHNVILPEAALTPFFLNKDHPLLGLQGVCLPVVIKTCGRKIADDLLFTHAGMSGPAILIASLYWEQGEPVTIDFLPACENPFSGEEKKTVLTALSARLPRRMVMRIVPAELAEKRCQDLTAEEQDKVKGLIHAYELLPASMAGLRQAEVCRGGVDCREIEPVTFVSRKNRHVSVIGETLDVTGQLGGYNLHWAFASGLLAARHLTRLFSVNKPIRHDLET